ncbi:prephenate dehydrogenase [Campylobacter pinnipediorum subsp. pinnipediorum]|nr:prephenate dehydrogenase [Campylobacter pinnipediorum subsp. pinnipediorum]
MFLLKIGILGLGLALKDQKSISCISGFDLNTTHQEKALSPGLVHEILTLDEMKEKCDIIFLAIPVETILKFCKI